ncbi:copper amine oxidase N-terminal domain-containing protein [Paenibacillus sp. FSL L8-0436]|uniref:copper amine oxidase N-terminal domain-containing protein n=1 Tax=Paenibacillus sp. FSL L8-0436 TaxID=2954686 RepID=UPI003158D86F
MKKTVFVSSLILAFSMLTSTCVMAASSKQELSLNINGHKEDGQKPIVINNITLVPIRTVSLLPDVKVDWNKKTKSVTVTENGSGNTLKLTTGSKIAYVNGNQVSLGAVPTVKNGAVYVPFRFIGESLKANVFWDTGTKTVVIYKTNQSLLNGLASTTLEKSRNAAIHLPRISLHEDVTPTQEGGAGGMYYFSYGKTNQFIYAYRGMAQYFEVKDGAAWNFWEGQVTETTNEKGIIPFVLELNGKEYGKRPSLSGKINFFMDYWKAEQVVYGTFDEKGNVIFQDTKTRLTEDPNIIQAIPGEQN